ncbi:MAG: hypothetical protein IJC41_00185 [Firmicutes bacterium]|nr:hypothetical protein [Bacillota bacterium]
MKKILSLLLVLILTLTAAGCGAADEGPEMGDKEAITQFLNDDLTALQYLLDNKESYTLLTGDEIDLEVAHYQWDEKKRVYEVSEDGVSSIMYYSGEIKLERDGTGVTLSPGTEPLLWAIEGDYFYFKPVISNADPVSGDPKYQYEVREIVVEDDVFGTVYALYGVENDTLILFIHPDSTLFE